MDNAITFLTSAALALGLASPGAANVFEVGSDGRLATRAGAGAVVWAPGGDEDGAADTPTAALTSPGDRTVPTAYAGAVARIAAENDLSPSLVEALVWQESRWNPAALSRAGALGLAQLMPATAREIGVDPRDPVANLAGGARYLRRQLDRFDGDIERALAAYNAGPARVARAGGIPAIAETRAYVAAILGRLASFTTGDRP